MLCLFLAYLFQPGIGNLFRSASILLAISVEMLALNVTPPRNGEVHKVVLLGFLAEPTEWVVGVKG